jgi:AraC family transcriptional regulator
MDAPLPLSGAAGVDPASSATLAQLLTDAFEALDGDIDRVRASLSRAVALVDGASTPGAASSQGGLAPWQARNISALVEAKLEYGVRTPELAASAGLSSSHFARAFRAHFGRSPKQYILEKRVTRAQRLMLAQRSRLSDVAQACGFADQAHLCRVFRRLVGASPHVWRRARIGL